MAAQPPLDEIVACRPEVIDWWNNHDKGGAPPPPYYHMEERFIHRYFSETPFFDHTSNNGLFFKQAETNISLHQLVHDRRALENRLRQAPGVEYAIVGEPQPVLGAGVQPGQKSNVWVLRKQERLRDVPEELERQNVRATPDNRFPATETQGTYFIVNENVYQAPSVADVVGSRMLSIVTNLESVFEKAAKLPNFTPTTGHTYLKPENKPTTTASTRASPARSREGSVAPGLDTTSIRSGSLPPESGDKSTASEDMLATHLLVASLRQTASFGDEYMDENPLLGEPGAFKFTSSSAAVKKRKADEEAAALAIKRANELKASSKTGSRAASPEKVVKPPTPPPVFTQKVVTAEKAKREGKEERKRRRKSRPNGGTATSPTTPKSAVSALGGASAG